MVTVLYVKGLTEAFTRNLKGYRISTAVKPHTNYIKEYSSASKRQDWGWGKIAGDIQHTLQKLWSCLHYWNWNTTYDKSERAS